MKTIATKYITPLILAVGITGGFVGFELSQAFNLNSTEKSVLGDDLSSRPSINDSSNPTGPHGGKGDDKRPTEPGPPHPRPIF